MRGTDWQEIAEGRMQLALIEAHKVRKLQAEVERLRSELNEQYVDENGTAWTRPTAEAYCKACQALDKTKAENTKLRQALREIADFEAKLERATQLKLTIDTIKQFAREKAELGKESKR